MAAPKPKALVSFFCGSFALVLLFVVLKLVHLIPLLRECVVRIMNKVTVVRLQKEDYWSSIFGWGMLKSVLSCLWLDLNKEARTGESAPNTTLIQLDKNNQSQLFEFANKDRPLVLNFGSITCPVFMARLQEFTSLVQEFDDIADFLTIYVEEAHPTDGWAFKNSSIRQHRSVEERCDAAKLLLQSSDLHTTLVVDTMDNETARAYGALPIRLYIIQDGRVQFIGGIAPTYYSVQDVSNWLRGWKSKDLLYSEATTTYRTRRGVVSIHGC